MRYSIQGNLKWFVKIVLVLFVTQAGHAARSFICAPALDQHHKLLSELQDSEQSLEEQITALKKELSLPESQRSIKDPRWFSFLRRGSTNPVSLDLQNQIDDKTMTLLKIQERLWMLRKYGSIRRDLNYHAVHHPDFQSKLAKRFVEFNNDVLNHIYLLIESPTTDGKILGSAYGVLSEIERGVSDVASGNLDEAAKVYRKFYDRKNMILGTLLKKQYFKMFGRSRPLSEETRQQIIQMTYSMDLPNTEAVLNRFVEIRKKVERLFAVGKVTDGDLISFLALSYSANADVDTIWHLILNHLRHIEQHFSSQREIPLGAAVKFAEISLKTKDSLQVIKRMKDIVSADKQDSKSHGRRILTPLAVALIVDASFKLSGDVISPHLYIYSNYQDVENHLYWIHNRKVEADELALVTLGVVLSEAMLKSGSEFNQAQLAVMNGINQTLKSISDEVARLFSRTLTVSELARLVRVCYDISIAPHELVRIHFGLKDMFQDQIPTSVLVQLSLVFKMQYQKGRGLQKNVQSLAKLTREQLMDLLYRPESMAFSIGDFLMDQRVLAELRKEEQPSQRGFFGRLVGSALGNDEPVPVITHAEVSRRNLDRMFEKVYFSASGSK